MNKPPLVEITWIDSCTHSGWRELEEAITRTTMKCVSVGYIIEKNDDMVSIVQSIADIGDVSELLCIPVAVIEELREV